LLFFCIDVAAKKTKKLEKPATEQKSRTQFFSFACLLQFAICFVQSGQSVLTGGQRIGERTDS
jgi:hypothetical protein